MELTSQDKNPLVEIITNKIKKYGWVKKNDTILQKKLSEESGVKKPVICRFFKGRNISSKNIYLILKCLDLIVLKDDNRFGDYNKRLNSKERAELMELKEEQMSILKKYAEALEENNRLKTKITSYEKILTFCQPPEGVEERRLCRMQYDKSFKEFDLQPL